MQSRSQILEEFSLFSVQTGGIGSWLTKDTHDDVFARLGMIDEDPLPAAQLNQLLVLAHEAPVSDGFFEYYWLQAPEQHCYDVRHLPGYSEDFLDSGSFVTSLSHLKWGLYRLYVDGLLFFGNIQSAFRSLRDLTMSDIEAFFQAERLDTVAMRRRGPTLPLKPIAKDSRYLISEMACKSYGDTPGVDGDLREFLLKAYQRHATAGNLSPTIRQLLDEDVPDASQPRQQEFLFSADEVLDESVSSEIELTSKYQRVANKFMNARQVALYNTEQYLSLLSELDVYVATSMRTREDFRKMADTCETIFSDSELEKMHLRYFDPTLSAAAGHEDKGLIECLMVKCAKVLVYCAGEKESYGKDAEAAMALSLGKPVIFYCDQEQRSRFYRDVHPLSRLIEFETGVAVGAMVTDRLEEVSQLLCRIFGNRMEYCLEQSGPGFLRLKEKLTGSVVRLQTNDQLLSEAFWNHYHREEKRAKRGVGGNYR